MDSINKIQLHLTKAIQKALNETSNSSLDKKLNAALRHLLDKNDNGELISTEIAEICKDVVYFVLNATDVRNAKRVFHVGMNWANLNSVVRKNQLINTTDYCEGLLNSDITSGVIPFSTKRNFAPTDEESEKLLITWNIIWQEYHKITTINENKSPKYLTINQWLLYYLNCPLNFGVYWGNENDDESADRNYIRLFSQTLEEMDISINGGGGAQFINLSSEFTGNYTDNGDLSQILAMLEEMDQKDSCLNLNRLPNIAFSVYHLLRSYGCWGGNAFYSIPINYGKYDRPIRGLLSVCSRKPMNAELVLKWYFVANKIFKDTILHEVDEISKEEIIAASYGLSHFYGSRLKLAAKPRTEAIAKLKNEFNFSNDVNEKLKESADEFKSIEELSALITIISKQHTEKADGAFFENCSDFNYLRSNNYDIITVTRSLFARVIKDKDIHLSTDLNSVLVTPFLKNGAYRPFDMLYENLIIELLRNFNNSKASTLFIKADVAAGCIYFMNIIKKDPNEFYDSEWQLLNSKRFWGAIYYLHLILRDTKVGELYFSYEDGPSENEIFYKCGLKLKGLKFNI